MFNSTSWHSSPTHLLTTILLTIAWAGPARAQSVDERIAGQQIYELQCAKCHGVQGEGVADVYDEVLSGDHSVDDLTRIIHETMPEDAPEDCEGEDARLVSMYIYDTFYSPNARLRNRPPRVELSHLTVRQYRSSLADWLNPRPVDPSRLAGDGLLALYYNSRGFSRDKLVIERTDPQINFAFGTESPDAEKIESEAFAIRWQGSVLARETGEYEFCVTSENGFRLWVNDRETPRIDAWVTSGGEPQEHTATVFLLAGRAYPIRLQFFKYKDKSASIQLAWQPPDGTRQVIPADCLFPADVPATLVITTPLPADDSSQGYARGTFVTKDWDEATTHAAIEAAAYVAERLDPLARTKRDESDRSTRIREFSHELAERAFRRPLTDEERRFFVDALFDETSDVDTAVKRSIMLTLKSPRFLYPGVATSELDDYEVASRLALTLWDSLPDVELLKAASKGELHSADRAAAHARRMLADSRARTKVRDFFHHWLEVDEGQDISRDADEYPGFGEELVADLRTSLDLFIEEVVWSDASDFRRLLLEDQLFMNDRLADFYEVELPRPGDEGFQKVTLDSDQRAGIVTHPYLLTTFAYYRSSSPIHRGVFLTRRLLGRALKPPPMAIQFMDNRFDPNLTMREKVSQLTESAACQTCHCVINPLGFSLEHFDAVGRFRTMEKQKPIDAESTYTTEEGDSIELRGARDLAEFAVGNAGTHLAFVEQLFQQIAAQPVRAYGPETLDRLHARFVESGYNIQTLLVEIATTVATRPVAVEGEDDA
jgi:hypothetical protein